MYNLRNNHNRIHLSWLIAWLAVGIIAGVGLTAVILPGWHPLQYGSVVLSLGFIAFSRRTSQVIPLIIIAGCCIGVWRGEVVQRNIAGYEGFIGSTVNVFGRVAEDTTMSASGEQRVRLRSVVIDGRQLPGEVWISMSTGLDIKRGDQLTVSGELQEGFGTLPASMNRAQLVQAERQAFGDVAREVRDWFASGVREAIDEPQASLGIGYLLGQRSTLPEDLTEQLRLLGLTHIVVASGYNLTILVRFARAAFVRVSKYLAAMSASGMIISFLLITGLSPSMSRAALVAGLSLLAWYFGRAIHPLVLLPFAAAVTALIQPIYVWGDLGWYLSFTSFAGVMILAPLLQHYFWGTNNEPGVMRRIVFETFSAQLLTLPLIAYVFAQYSPLALPANLLILPLIPLTMLLTFVAGVIGLFVPTIAAVAGLPAFLVLRYMTGVTDWLSQLPWASGELVVGLPFLVIGYVVLLLLMIMLWRVTRHNFRRDNIVV